MSNNVCKWCFIGAGKLANKVAEEILGSTRHEIVSVYTRNKQSGETFAKEYSAMYYESAKEAMENEQVEAVYVVTPHSNHYEYVKLALELKKPVLCEKAFTVNYKEAKELAEIAKANAVYMAEAMWTWFSPVANKVKEWIKDGVLGEIEEVHGWYHQMLFDRGGRLTDANRAGGALLDIGVYPITYAYRLFGMPEEISCEGVLKDSIDYKEEINMKFSDGFTADISISMMDEERKEIFAIKGSKGRIEVPWFHMAKEAFLVKENGEKEIYSGDGSLLNEFDQVAKEIKKGCLESRFVPRQATLDVMKIMDVCREQMGLQYPFEVK